MEPKNQPTVPLEKLPKRKRILDTYVGDFWAKVGDKVYFKNVPRKRRVEWTVTHIETDPGKCRWTKGSNKPNFVHLQRADKPAFTVWTCSDQLQTAGFKK